ncbi:Uncharacterised protein [Dermatophilus congolensis]|uniref:Uncharacterized protein n=1 Tax=Dermatophilus congolensis TaxID=1863 RepID=A0AA46BNS3_9MICO|nr:Uncharacterised protein [Dermatophilus congolensis]
MNSTRVAASSVRMRMGVGLLAEDAGEEAAYAGYEKGGESADGEGYPEGADGGYGGLAACLADVASAG